MRKRAKRQGAQRCGSILPHDSWSCRGRTPPSWRPAPPPAAGVLQRRHVCWRAGSFGHTRLPCPAFSASFAETGDGHGWAVRCSGRGPLRMINTLRSHLGARRGTGTVPRGRGPVRRSRLRTVLRSDRGQAQFAGQFGRGRPGGFGTAARRRNHQPDTETRGANRGRARDVAVRRQRNGDVAPHPRSCAQCNAARAGGHRTPCRRASISLPRRRKRAATAPHMTGSPLSVTLSPSEAGRARLRRGSRRGTPRPPLPSAAAHVPASNAVNGTKPEAVPKPPFQEIRDKPDAPTEENAGAKVTGGPGKTPTVPRNVAADNGIRPNLPTQPANIDSRPVLSSPKPPDLTAPPARTDAAKPGPGAGPQPQAGAATVPAPMVAMFVQRGNQRLAEGDISSARLLFERAAAARSGAGAFGLARTYDPVFLTQIRAHGIQADLGLAISWYREAAALGEPEAQDALDRLEGLDLESCKRLTMNPPVTP